MTLIDSFLGRIRAPHYAQLTIDTRTGKLVMSFKAQSDNNLTSEFTKEYEGQLINGQVVADLVTMLKQTAIKFWGSESGGL